MYLNAHKGVIITWDTQGIIDAWLDEYVVYNVFGFIMWFCKY